MLFALASVFVLTACKKDKFTSYDYELTLPCAEEERVLVLDKMMAPIANVTCSDDWLSVTICDEMYDGHPAIGDRPYWYDGQHWAWFKVYCELIFYKNNYTYGEYHASAPFLLKIDWIGDDDIYDGASIGY